MAPIQHLVENLILCCIFHKYIIIGAKSEFLVIKPPQWRMKWITQAGRSFHVKSCESPLMAATQSSGNLILTNHKDKADKTNIKRTFM